MVNLSIVPHESQELDMILDALANKKRRYILHILSLSPRTISSLSSDTNLSLPAIHKHIRILESSNLIIRKKAGRTNFISFNPKTFSLAQLWINQYITNWGNPEASLTNYVPRMKE